MASSPSRYRVELEPTFASLGELSIAGTMWQRAVGLLGRRELAARDGLVIAPCVQIHTWFMRFPIDVVFLDREDRVVKVVSNLGPFKTAFGGFSARAVLELPAGTAATAGVVPGMRVRMVPA